MTQAPSITARVEVASDAGNVGVGYSSDLIVPKWFDKNPRTSIHEDTQALLRGAREAARMLLGFEPACVFDHWLKLYRACVEPSPIEARLVRGFGVALLERALIDAACRAEGLSFFDALDQGLLGFEPGCVSADLDDWKAADELEAPADRILLRHTVGLADPLWSLEIPDEARVGDGLPHALEEDIERYGLRCFKIKACGDRKKDVQRLWTLAELLADRVSGDWTFTLDGNEQFESIHDLLEMLRDLSRTGSGTDMISRMMYVEQPLARAKSFDRQATAGIEDLSELAPVIIDEADVELASFPQALASGYSGVSVKACKGVFRALINAARCTRAPLGAFVCAEDLTNLGVVALQQDLALATVLGLRHIERNGHHYFRGLDHLPEAEQRDALELHGDLYEATPFGASLRIENGELDIRSLRCPGFGYKVAVRENERTPLETWEASAQ